MSKVEVVNNLARHRYEALLDGRVAGFSEYQLTEELVVLTHTEVGDEYEGQGVGSALVQGALDDVRAIGMRKVLPLCPFVRAWLGRHRDYRDLLYHAPRSTARD
jgi:predicted GNAT family acetyltransferase